MRMCVSRVQQQIWRLAPLAIAVVLSALVFPSPGQPTPVERVRDRQPDVGGGYASTHVVVRVTPELMKRVASSAFERGGNHTLPQSVLSPDLEALCGRWAVIRIRPWYPFPFEDPALAAKYGFDRLFLVEVPRGTDTPMMAAAFRTLGADIESAGLDAIGGIAGIPNDPEFWQQHGLYNTGQMGGTNDADIDALEAWTIHTGETGTPVTVAIIDSGVTPHPEFADRMVPGINTISPETPDHTIDGCGFGHGTPVASVVAAQGDNGLGMAGVTWGAQIMPVRVLNFCGGPASAAAAGLLWAVDHGADVCNLSLQYSDLDPPSLEAFESAVDYAHDNSVVVIAAAGNWSGGCNPGEVTYPGAFGNAIAVSGTDRDDQFASFSCFGPEVDISAPGDDILSALVTQAYYLHHGTSMATPHVTGVAALLKSFLPTLGPDGIRSILQDTADDLGDPGRDQYFGYGRLNAYNALVEGTTRIEVVSSSPPDGAIDARIPHSPIEPSIVHGWDSVEMTFTCRDVTSFTSGYFTITETGGDGVAPDIDGVEVLADDSLRITLTEPIESQAWTALEHTASGAGIRLGSLPADVNGDGTSDASDVAALVNHLHAPGTSPLEVWQADIDRNGKCGPRDILRTIDLLNGAGCYDPWLDASIPDCPTMAP